MTILKEKVTEPFQERLVEEFEQLTDRIDKLEAAFKIDNFKDKVGERQFFLMGKQLVTMKSYASTLGKRMLDLGIAE